jgi:hypothetical protein
MLAKSIRRRLAGGLLTTALVAASVGAVAAQPSSFAGRWDTQYNAMRLRQDDSGHVTGPYAFNDGRIEGQVNDRTLTGYWAQSSSEQRCAISRLGSRYWGRLSFVLSADGGTFTGRWNYCSADPSGSWSGTRAR